MLRLPYDVANRLNRRQLLAQNEELTRAISPDDYRIGPVGDRAFDLQHRLPGWMLRVPYDVLNRLNRRRLLVQNQELTNSISPDDYRLAPVGEGAFDLFYIGTKP
jgi:hypothetical protein